MSPSAVIATRQSFGVSTSATDSKNVLMKSQYSRSSQPKMIKGGGSVDGNAMPKFEFSKLVNSIMSNPFTTSGMNTSNVLARQYPKPSNMSSSRRGHSKAGRDNSRSFRKAGGNIDRYR